MSWKSTFTTVIDASPAEVFAVFAAVGRWPEWNAGVEHIILHGPFETGSWFSMKPTGEDEVESELIEVDKEKGFTDRTVMGDVTVIVEHRLTRLGPDETRVDYLAEVTGPDAEAIGHSVTADFDEVMSGLKRQAEGALNPG